MGLLASDVAPGSLRDLVSRSVRSGQMTSSLASTCTHTHPHTAHTTHTLQALGQACTTHTAYSTHHRHGVGHIQPHTAHTKHDTGTESCMHSTYNTHHRYGVRHVQPPTKHTALTIGTVSGTHNPTQHIQHTPKALCQTLMRTV